jgi:glycosyltransferase involved in cell wall biosynthesis
MTAPLVVVDADVLGRRRTGDETYVRNLLRELGALAPDDLRFAAATRHPELVPAGIEPLELRTPVQELRMLLTLPRLLRRSGAALVHTQYAVPLGAPCPAVVTIHDLSFEHDREHMALKDRVVFRRVVPAAARRARRVLTVSERTRADLVRLYGLPPEKVVVTPNAVDPVFTPGSPLTLGTYVLVVGAVQPRKNQLAALAAAAAVPLPLVVAGPVKNEALAAELRAGGADLRGYVDQEELADLYRGAACLVQPSRFEGFGLPVLEAMACGTPVVALDEPALREVAGDAAIFVDEEHVADGVLRALEERERLSVAGIERAKAFSWRVTAERTLAVYREALA